MKFKEKTTTIAITEKSRKIIRELTDEIKEKTGTHMSVAEFIEQFINVGAILTKDQIINEYLTITAKEADSILAEIDNVSR